MYQKHTVFLLEYQTKYLDKPGRLKDQYTDRCSFAYTSLVFQLFANIRARACIQYNVTTGSLPRHFLNSMYSIETTVTFGCLPKPVP